MPLILLLGFGDEFFHLAITQLDPIPLPDPTMYLTTLPLGQPWNAYKESS